MRSVRLSCLVVIVTLVSAAQGSVVQKLEQDIRGKVKNSVYTSIHKEYTVRVPELAYPGALVRDESGDEGSQVIFTDDFGAFYRVVLLEKSVLGIELDDSLVVFKHVREKEALQTARGREWRLIDIEPEGAELSIKTLQPDGSWKERRPDLVVAASAFEHDGRLYHVVAGVAVLNTKVPIAQSVEVAIKQAKERLDAFLAGFTPAGKK